MATTTGKVRCIQILDDLGGTTIQINATTTEALLLWIAGEHPVHLRVIHSNWVSLLRQAMASDLQVSIVHPDGSALASSVQLGPS